MAELTDPSAPGYLDAQLKLRRIRLEDGGRGEHYPFDAWADGRERRAFPGIDFIGIKPSSFVSALNRWGRRWKTDVWAMKLEDGSVLFKIYPLEQQQISIRNNSYGPILYDFEKERGY